MRDIPVDDVADTVRRLCVEANHELREDQVDALRRARSRDESPIGQEVLDRLLANAEVSAREQIAFCQDTGYAVCFLEIGQDVPFTDAPWPLERKVAEGYRDGYRGLPRGDQPRLPLPPRTDGDL